MRIFCCSNHCTPLLLFRPFPLFQSAMRIFCCSNASKGTDIRLRSPLFQSAMRIFCCSNTGVILAGDLREGFQSAMRIFCCSNSGQNSSTTSLHCLFQSAMRIFCCSNFYSVAEHSVLVSRFQSAMRIFCCSNILNLCLVCQTGSVSIRDADFLLFELHQWILSCPALERFNPRCGFFAVRTNHSRWFARSWLRFNPRCGFFAVRTRIPTPRPVAGLRFNPRCGFFAVRTRTNKSTRNGKLYVSIRDADFLLFEPALGQQLEFPTKQFQSAMRIFCCSNRPNFLRLWEALE